MPPSLFACLRSIQRRGDAVEIAREFSPRIQRYGAACVVLDVAGLGRLLGEPGVIGAEIDRAAAARGGIQVVVAPTQMASLLLSFARPALTVVTTDVAAALAPVPMQVLPQFLADLHGVTMRRPKQPVRSLAGWPSWPACERAFDMLQRWGLRTLGELAALPAADLSARMGQEGLALQQLARGVDPRPLVPDPGVPRFLERMELEWPIDMLEPLAFVLARLLDPLSAALERADRAAAAIRLDLRLVDRTTHARVLQLPSAMRDARVLRTLVLLDLESHPPPAGIDVVTIELDPAPGRILQYSLLDRPLPSAETIATLSARLGALVGETRCGTPVLADTCRPDAVEMRRFAPDDRQPLRAGPPAGIGSMCVSLRRFRPPVAIRVTVERGRPVHVAIDRRGMPGGLVGRAAGPWRTSGAWWDPAAAHWDRDEWDVAFADGVVCRLFRESESGRWFLEGVLD